MAVKKSELYSLLWEACNKLRGGVEPSRYKDYVLVLLFFKYVSDRYKGQRFAEFTVSEGASFDDLIAAKGKSDVGERVDKIIQKFLEENRLQGSLPDVSFNNPDELGSGKELVDKVSGLIAIFQNPAIDFKSNRASGDDIIGDAYEYFMMKFAQESGKSKGQFYTPSEVSRIIARLIEENDNATDDIDSKLEELQQQLLIQAKSKNDYEDVADEIYRLRELKQNALVENAEREGKRQRIAEMTDFLNEQSCELEEYDEQLVRRLIEKVTIYEDKLTVEFKSGIEIDEEI